LRQAASFWARLPIFSMPTHLQCWFTTKNTLFFRR